MSSMNNWLAFSLSPQQLPSQTENHTQSSTSRLGFNSDDDCFDLASDSTAPSLNLPSSFGILEAFNNTNHESNEWNNVKDMSSMSCDTNNFKPTSSEYSMFLGGGSSNSNIVDHQEEPKLEDFLGGHSFSGHECNNSNNHPMTATGDYMFSHDQSHGHGAVNSNSIGLSMIKTWLRNQPAPTQSQQPQLEKNNSTCTSGGGNTTQTLSLSMGTGSQPATTIAAASGGNGVESCSSDNTQIVKTTSTTSLDSQTGAIEAVLPPRKSIDTFGQRTSIYRGVTRHRWTGRYEAHLWDNSCRREGQTRKGRQVYLGGYDKEEKAARAYDLAALKYWGSTTTTNFPISNYEKELEDMKVMNRQEYVASLRRKSSGFSRGASIYRGVTRHHQHGRWQARIGRVAGNKDLYLGTFSTQEEAAEAYDIAAIKFRGLNAVTNFEMNRYDVNSIMESSTLPIGGNAKRLKEAEHQLIEASTSVDGRRTDDDNITSQLTEGGVLNSYGTSNHYHHHPWSSISFNQAQPLSIMNYPSYGSGQQRGWCKQEQDVVFQDLHQLQLASTHNFFQPSNVLHNLMSLDSSSMEHSSGSNSVIYSSGSGSGGGSNGSFQGGNHGGYVMPMGMVIDDQSTHNHATCFGEHEAKQLGYDTLLTSTADPYNHQSSNPYYPTSQQHQSSTQGPPGSNNWIPTALQTLTPRTNSLSLCHGGVPAFTVWNDT